MCNERDIEEGSELGTRKESKPFKYQAPLPAVTRQMRKLQGVGEFGQESYRGESSVKKGQAQ